IPPLGEAPEALPAAPPDHCHLADPVQGFEHLCDLAPAEPAMLAAPLRRPVLELARQERAATLELAQDVAAKPRVLAQELPPASVPAMRRDPSAAPHQGTDQR